MGIQATLKWLRGAPNSMVNGMPGFADRSDADGIV